MILLIHLEHQIKIFGTLFNRFIINRTPVQTEQLALSADTKFTIWRDYFFEDFSIPSFSEALLQKSTSTSNLPIFSYNACSLFSASSSGAFVEKISGLRERNSLFQFEIICGWIPKRLDRSLRVSCSLIASMATCALKAALCFFLLVFIRVKLIISLNLPSGLNLREYYSPKKGEFTKSSIFPALILDCSGHTFATSTFLLICRQKIDSFVTCLFRRSMYFRISLSFILYY